MTEENVTPPITGERERRLAKVQAIRAAGGEPYPVRFDRTHSAAEISAIYAPLESGSETDDQVRVAGRIMLLRRQGKLTFATLRDGSGEVQLFVSQAEMGNDEFAAFDDLDLGDWVGVGGRVMKTRKGEV